MIDISRRDFLRYALASTSVGSIALNPWMSRAFAAATDLPIPDFSNRNIMRTVVGLRPLRPLGIRLDLEQIAEKYIVHNYGHGGSGFTLSWGSAEEAANLADEVLPGLPASERSVAVIGAGVIGLTTASILLDRGYKVTIYSAKITPNTTSDLAGAQWSPSFVSKGTTPQEIERYHRIVRFSYRRFAMISGADYGVSLRPNYIPNGFKDGLQDVEPGVLEPTLKLAKLPFASLSTGGSMIKSWLIEPPVFMPKMISDLKARGVVFNVQTFSDIDELRQLPETVIMNCTGLGAAELVNDRNVIPMRGQLVHLYPKKDLNYILLNRGYIFCRSDAIVIGGSYERGSYDMQASQKTTEKILQNQRDFFGL
jgi:D-amino-acid oxidase